MNTIHMQCCDNDLMQSLILILYIMLYTWCSPGATCCAIISSPLAMRLGLVARVSNNEGFAEGLLALAKGAKDVSIRNGHKQSTSHNVAKGHR